MVNTNRRFFSNMADSNTMSAQEIAESKLAFMVLDRNSDGKVSSCDLKVIMHKLGNDVDDEDCKAFIGKVSCNGSVSFSEKDFLSWMDEYREKNTENVLLDAFQAFDKDKNGYISREELRQGLVMMGEHLTDDMLDSMFEEADANHDGKISLEEFIHIMNPS